MGHNTALLCQTLGENREWLNKVKSAHNITNLAVDDIQRQDSIFGSRGQPAFYF